MFGLMLIKTHGKIVAELRDRLDRQRSTIATLQEEIISNNVKIVDISNALNCEKKNVSKLRELTKFQEQSLGILNSKLANAVEGLSDKDKRILEQKAKGNYIYYVTAPCADKLGVMCKNINVPMTTSNCGDYAKRQFLKYFGLNRDHIKECTVERWTI